MIKPTRVLCKRSLIIGDPFWWDESTFPAKKVDRDNRMLVKGDWYDVVENPNDSWDEEKRNFTFSIIDNQKHLHLFYMYEERDKVNWPESCTDYGPRDYAKWFYTPEELEVRSARQTKKSQDLVI